MTMDFAMLTAIVIETMMLMEKVMILRDLDLVMKMVTPRQMDSLKMMEKSKH